jgi:hypothetical protein
LFLKLLMPMAHPSTKPSLRSNLEPAQQSGACAATWVPRSKWGRAPNGGVALRAAGFIVRAPFIFSGTSPRPVSNMIVGPFGADETPKV